MSSTATFHSHDYTFDIASEEELMHFFRPRDQKRVIVRRDLEFPMRAQYYFTWGESSGVYRYLVFKRPGWETPMGVVFRVGSSHPDSATGGICDWCHAYGDASQIGLLTVSVNPKRTIGFILCRELNCGDKIENNPSTSSKVPETRILQVCERIGRFFDENIRPSASAAVRP